MVATNSTSAPTTTLPTLSRADRCRLDLYFARGQSTELLALELDQIHQQQQSHVKSNTPPSPFAEALEPLSPHSPLLTPHSPPPPPPDSYDLAAWTLSEQIAPHIAYRRAESLERRKQSALAELDAILANSESLIEKRRAATTLLRAIATQLHRNRTTSPSTGGAGRDPVSTSPTHAPSSGAEHSRTQPRAADSSSPLSSPTTPPSPPPLPPTPRATPSPSLTADQVLSHIISAIIEHDDPGALATLELFLAPDATLDGEPVNPHSLPAQVAAIAPGSDVLQIFPQNLPRLDPGPPEAHISKTCLVLDKGPNAFLDISLARPLAGCWLLASLEHSRDSS